MSSRLIVLNEWVLHDLCGHNNQPRQREAAKLVEAIDPRCIKVAVQLPSPWTCKLYRFAKELAPSDDPRHRLVVKTLPSVLRDSQRCKIVREHEVRPLEPELAAKLPRKDVYLVKTYLAAKADLLVAEDAKLLDALHEHCRNVNAQTRDDFMRELGICP